MLRVKGVVKSQELKLYDIHPEALRGRDLHVSKGELRSTGVSTEIEFESVVRRSLSSDVCVFSVFGDYDRNLRQVKPTASE